MMPEAGAFLLHRIKGRVRLVIPSRKKDPSFFTLLETELRNFPMVEQIRSNPLIGSVLICFNGQWAALRERLDASSILKVSSKGQRKKGDAIERIFRELGHLDRRVEKATQGELNLVSMVGLGLIGLSALQASKKNFLPPASSLFSEGMRLLVYLNERNREAER